MSPLKTPSDADPHARGTSAQNHRSARPPKRPWGWIAVAGLLAAGVAGAGIYAATLNSDLDDANATIASQQKRIAAQQEEIDDAHTTGADVVAAAKRAYEDLTASLGVAQQGATQASEQAAATLDQAAQAAADAKGRADDIRRQAIVAQAKAKAAAGCAESFLSAFGGVFDGPTPKAGVEAAVADLKALQPGCAAALREKGSAP